MNDVIDNVKKDLQSANILCKAEFKKDNPELVIALAGLIAEERRRQKKVFSGTPVTAPRMDPIEAARRSPRKPALPVSAIGTSGTAKKDPPVAAKAPRASKTEKSRR